VFREATSVIRGAWASRPWGRRGPGTMRGLELARAFRGEMELPAGVGIGVSLRGILPLPFSQL
jgi:hypothetical protein